ncbi:MAG: type II toxin-antitoxin system YafQ family toxin [Clostridia bacterium]|jgi:mRNA interferase YafQ|nr:type II toxin-antitoxin system YafQ family toxin [Clostridia bacterium]
MKYQIEVTNSFKKAYKIISKRGYDKSKLQNVIDLLAKGEQLPEKYKDHSLKGSYAGHRECHIEPDWLLVYKKIEDILVLVLIDTGTHSDLFKM